MNGPTVKCTVNHNKPGAKKKGGGQLWVIKKLLTLKMHVFTASHTHSDPKEPGDDFLFFTASDKKTKKPKNKKTPKKSNPNGIAEPLL